MYGIYANIGGILMVHVTIYIYSSTMDPMGKKGRKLSKSLQTCHMSVTSYKAFLTHLTNHRHHPGWPAWACQLPFPAAASWRNWMMA